jgi:membrane dipeptidase
VGLTWNKDNILAGGCEGCGHLTSFGSETISRLNENKITIDTAHLNEKSFMEVANIADRIICSHTAFSGVFDAKRNLKDYQIKMIIDRGGIIGLNLVSHFLSPSKKSDKFDIIRHIEYFLDKYGDANLCFGTDYFGAPDIVKVFNQYNKLPTIEKELKKIGYSDETIARIFYKNAEKFFNEV